MTSDAIRSYEKPLVALDGRPWDALCRIALGLAIVPVLSRFYEGNSDWAPALFLLSVLFALRLVPAVLRKLIGFSPAAQAVWSERRLRAKHYDSYQWQKLFWIGIGLSAYLVSAGDVSAGKLALAVVCLAAGGAGLMVWRSRTKPGIGTSRSGQLSTKQNLLPASQQKP